MEGRNRKETGRIVEEKGMEEGREKKEGKEEGREGRKEGGRGRKRRTDRASLYRPGFKSQLHYLRDV